MNIARLLHSTPAGLVLALAAALGASPSFAAEAAASAPAASAPASGAWRAGNTATSVRADCAASAPRHATSKARHVPDESDPCAASTGAVPAGKR